MIHLSCALIAQQLHFLLLKFSAEVVYREAAHTDYTNYECAPTSLIARIHKIQTKGFQQLPIIHKNNPRIYEFPLLKSSIIHDFELRLRRFNLIPGVIIRQ